SGAPNAEEFFDAIRGGDVALADRYRSAHTKRYPVLIWILMEIGNKGDRLAKIAECARMKFFPGHYTKAIKPDAEEQFKALNAETQPIDGSGCPATEEQIAQCRHEAGTLIEADDPLEWIKAELLRLGYGGDLRPLVILYICWATRLLKIRKGAIPA